MIRFEMFFKHKKIKQKQDENKIPPLQLIKTKQGRTKKNSYYFLKLNSVYGTI